MKKLIIFSIAASLLIGTAVFAQSAALRDFEQDFHIDKDGNVTMHQAKIVQVSGTTLYARYYVGLAFIRILIKTNSGTHVYRRFGDEIPLREVKADDIVNIAGTIESGADSLSIIASTIINFSNQKEVTNFTGTITGFGTSTGSFILTTKNQTVITIATGTSTQIRKGSRIMPAWLVRTGDKVIDASGTYDHTSRTLDANTLVLYINMAQFKSRNFEGTLKRIVSDNTLIVNTEGTDYTVVLSPQIEILTKTRKATSLKRYLEGDKVRLYGTLRESEEPMIDTELIRNISLQ